MLLLMQPVGSQPKYVQSLPRLFGAARYYLYLVRRNRLRIELERRVLQDKRPDFITRAIHIQMSLPSARQRTYIP
jgi:hypothetical protein